MTKSSQLSCFFSWHPIASPENPPPITMTLTNGIEGDAMLRKLRGIRVN
jgi:hypothetical protein